MSVSFLLRNKFLNEWLYVEVQNKAKIFISGEGLFVIFLVWFKHTM